MDIINILHSAFRNVEHFEFGDDFVKVFDAETGKHYKISIEEVKPAEKSILKGQGSTIDLKTIKPTSKGKKKTWESILKERT